METPTNHSLLARALKKRRVFTDTAVAVTIVDDKAVPPTIEETAVGTAEELPLPTVDDPSILSLEGKRYVTRASQYGRFEPKGAYDQKYHPMDKVTRPTHAARRGWAPTSRLSWRDGIDDNDADDDDDRSVGSWASGTSIDALDDDVPVVQLATPPGVRRSKRSEARKSRIYNARVHPQDDSLPGYGHNARLLRRIRKNRRDGSGTDDRRSSAHVTTARIVSAQIEARDRSRPLNEQSQGRGVVDSDAASRSPSTSDEESEETMVADDDVAIAGECRQKTIIVRSNVSDNRDAEFESRGRDKQHLAADSVLQTPSFEDFDDQTTLVQPFEMLSGTELSNETTEGATSDQRLSEILAGAVAEVDEPLSPAFASAQKPTDLLSEYSELDIPEILEIPESPYCGTGFLEDMRSTPSRSPTRSLTPWSETFEGDES